MNSARPALDLVPLCASASPLHAGKLPTRASQVSPIITDSAHRPANSFGLRYVDSDYDEWSDSDSEVQDDSFLFGDDDPEPRIE